MANITAPDRVPVHNPVVAESSIKGGQTMRRLLTLLPIVSVLVAPIDIVGSGQAAPLLQPQSGPWDPTGSFSFEGDSRKLRRALSGIACRDSASLPRTCLVVFDEGMEARHVVIDDGSYSLDGERVVLGEDGELDAEAAATDGQYYYVSGSHSVKREGCDPNPASRQVIRIPIDQASGKARHAPDNAVAGESDKGRLWSLMNQRDDLNNFVGKCLGDPSQGVNIEGLAVKGGRLYFGFRGPADKGVARILSVDATALFADGDLSPSMTTIEVGEGRGIRDLAAVRDGFLILSGPDDTMANHDKGWGISFWDGTSSVAGAHVESKGLAELDLSGVDLRPCDRELKPEALAVTADAPEHYTIVVLSDGMCDGGALQFKVVR
jgi:Protein of unknown function (DUF3616)